MTIINNRPLGENSPNLVALKEALGLNPGKEIRLKMWNV
jgi:hypothetical protein